MGKIIVLDNFDSFTYNLVHYIEDIICDKVTVVRNDEYGIEYFDQFDTIFLSPGPGLPINAGIMPDLIKYYSSRKNIFGVCLGMQGIAQNFGAVLNNLRTVYHGVGSKMQIIDRSELLFTGVPDNFSAGRYHSWIVNKSIIPKEIKITCEDGDGNIMALRHTKFNVHGVQFHPESILTPHGKKIIENFLLYYT